jgi:glycosyltransferase involved in cell wall biosynthesis
VYLGRLSAEKGVWTLVRAFEQLKEVPLKIVGTGPLETALKEYVRERNITNVHFVGFKQGEEKWALLQDSVCTVVPSEWYENFPIVVLEAYAAGKPVIGSNLGSLPYVIEQNHSGLLFEAGNPADLAAKVRELFCSPAKRAVMGSYARTLVENKYSPQQSYQTLKTIFTQVQNQS